jgi:Family of unknown function (DUF5678)
VSEYEGMDLTEALRKRLEEQLEAESELSRRLRDFVGRWVAVKDHKVVADAATLDELLRIIDVDDVEAVLEVEEKSGTAAFF